MKKSNILAVCISVLLALGLVLMGCDDGNGNGGGGGGGGKIPAALQGTWIYDDYDYYLVFTKDSFGNAQTLAEATEKSAEGSFIAVSANENKIEFEHKDFGKDYTGYIAYSLSGSTLTISDTDGGGAFPSKGTYTKQ